MRAFLYTIFALGCFAFNSILCRLALKADEIDAASFTSIRIVSGAVTLVIISFFINKTEKLRGNWFSAFFLCAYAACFSFAYVSLSTATGALVLFGSVQATMIVAAILAGERPGIWEWIGLLTALAGLIYLVFPGLSAPPLFSSLLMTLAGIAWGFYTLRGRGAGNPIAETTGNFLRAAAFALLASAPFLGQMHLSTRGIVFAVLSGAVASGIGYSVWYAALKFHTASRAAILQLAVPVIAAAAGIMFLNEEISLRLILASCLVLGGIALKVKSEG
jgi:drug/metabolite transporter (DMT)-like permease